MLSIGLTGNVGCGKSTVAEMWRELGAVIIDADRIVHELLAPGGGAVEAVLAAFPAAAGDDGGIDRARLAEVVFADVERRRELEAILHPLVLAESRRRLAELEARGCPLAVTEAALLYEAVERGTGDESSLERFDAVVVVTCTPDEQLRRLRARGLEDGEALARAAAQMPQEEKARRADAVIDNSGSLERTREQVRVLNSRIVSGLP